MELGVQMNKEAPVSIIWFTAGFQVESRTIVPVEPGAFGNPPAGMVEKIRVVYPVPCVP